jgi:hypothetical protein
MAAWSLWGLTMALEITAIWCGWITAAGEGGYFLASCVGDAHGHPILIPEGG